MVEGGSSKDFARSKALLYGEPAILHRLLAKLARATTDYLNAQIRAGAQAVMLFDTWGGALAPAAYREFSLNYMAEVIAGLLREHGGARVPAILFTKGAGLPFGALAASGADALGLDWLTDLGVVRAQVGERVALQGNLDPAALYAGPEAIRREVGRVLASFGHGDGHVFNLGHGIRPDVDPGHVGELVAAVHALSPPYHASSGGPRLSGINQDR
jgi:uroporphyrinogen decarboxylase